MRNIQTTQIKENREKNNQITDNQIDKFFAVFKFSLSRRKCIYTDYIAIFLGGACFNFYLCTQFRNLLYFLFETRGIF